MAVGIVLAVGLGPGVPGGVIGDDPVAPDRPSSQQVKDKADAKVTRMVTNLARLELRWERRGYRVDVHAAPAFNCAKHSYGQVQRFFMSRGCDYMLRAYGVFRDKHRDVVLVAFSWVEVPTASDAADLKTLVDTGGTGNVTELSRDEGSYQRVKYLGLGYDCGIEDRPTRRTSPSHPAGNGRAVRGGQQRSLGAPRAHAHP